MANESSESLADAMSSQPTNNQRRILLAVTGLSPQVVTETLYALAADPEREQAWVPTEIHLITTTRGAENARLQLLHPVTGWFWRLLNDYRLPPIRFDESSVHLIERADGTPLDDIRDDVDNRLAADTITEWVRRLTGDPYSEVHASIAGGRKTMGFFLGYAMSLYGRPQDRLSHVLVSSPYESSTEFFYPTPYSQVIRKPRSDNEVLDASHARVWLGDIPFVRLRNELDVASRQRTGAAFADAVQSVQDSLSSQRLCIDLSRREVLLGRERVVLRPVDLAMLLWVIERQKAECPVRRNKVSCDEAHRDAAEFLRVYESLHWDTQDDQTRTHERLREGLLKDFFDERLSRLRNSFRRALGEVRAEPYLIRARGARGHSVYTLPLAPDRIEVITALENP